MDILAYYASRLTPLEIAAAVAIAVAVGLIAWAGLQDWGRRW